MNQGGASRGLVRGAGVLVVALAMGLGGCAGKGAAGARFVVEGSAPGMGVVRAEEGRVHAPGVVRYVAWEGSESAKAEVRTAAPGKGESRWRVARWSIRPEAKVAADRERLDLEEVYVRLGDGSVALAEQFNYVEGVEVVFDPPMVVLPGELAAEGSGGSGGLSQALRMTVHPKGDRTKVRASGTVRQEVRYEADERVRTPAGQMTAKRVHSIFRADLGATAVRNESDVWVAPGLGIIAERRSERTTVLGVPIRFNEEKWVAAENSRAAKQQGNR